MKMINLMTGNAIDLPEAIADIMRRKNSGGPVNEFEEGRVTDFLVSAVGAEASGAAVPEAVELDSEPCPVCTLIDKAVAAEQSYDALVFAKAARTLAETFVAMDRLN